MVHARSTGNEPTDFEPGTRCLLRVAARHFLVEVVEVKDDLICVTFPVGNFPLEGMRVVLEFHDTEGYTRYDTVVVRGPSKVGDGIVLNRPEAPQRTLHRSSYRVPTDLTAQVKDQVHVRRYDADLLDISEGGVLMRSPAPFDFDTTVELTISFPGESVYTFLGTVAHMNEPADGTAGERVFGVRFFDTDPEAAHAAARFVHQRIKDLHSEG